MDTKNKPANDGAAGVPMRADIATIEERLDRVEALMVAMQAIAVAGDNVAGRGSSCATLEIMAAEEMHRARAAMGAEVLNRDC